MTADGAGGLGAPSCGQSSQESCNPWLCWWVPARLCCPRAAPGYPPSRLPGPQPQLPLQTQLPTDRSTPEPVTAHGLLREDRGQEASPSLPIPRPSAHWRTRILVLKGAELLLTFLPEVPEGECVTRPLEGMLLGLQLDKATLKLLATRAPAHTAFTGPYSPSTEPSSRPLLPSFSRGPALTVLPTRSTVPSCLSQNLPEPTHQLPYLFPSSGQMHNSAKPPPFVEAILVCV